VAHLHSLFQATSASERINQYFPFRDPLFRHLPQMRLPIPSISPLRCTRRRVTRGRLFFAFLWLSFVFTRRGGRHDVLNAPFSTCCCWDIRSSRFFPPKTQGVTPLPLFPCVRPGRCSRTPVKGRAASRFNFAPGAAILRRRGSRLSFLCEGAADPFSRFFLERKAGA